MKKTALVLLLCIVLTLLAGCGGRKNNADVHVFYYTYSDTYISSVRNALDKKLKDADISYQDYDGGGSQTIQTEQIQTAITKGAKLIIVNIVNTGSDDAANGIVNMARNANIPVIFFNREVSDSVISSYDKCAFVGTRAEESGILQGQMIGEYLLKNYDKIDLNGDGEISYILFKGEEGNNEAIYRTKYSVEEANKLLEGAGRPALRFYDASNPNGYLVDKNGQWSAAAANEYMVTALTSYSEASGNMIELVICNNDGMAEGAISALSGAGYNKGGNSKMIPVFGVDATDAAKDLIANGKMSGTIKQDAEGMAEVIKDLAENVTKEGQTLLSDLEDYDVDAGVAKIRISYSKYLG
ncbi:MAG: galactose ABC transporter substrate-binding protein [Ruminococcaceae bacterium]|nr:galactose ABC transporter substrate-binding protein [Oscillospiraceae bacterium]